MNWELKIENYQIINCEDATKLEDKLEPSCRGFVNYQTHDNRIRKYCIDAQDLLFLSFHPIFVNIWGCEVKESRREEQKGLVGWWSTYNYS